ncbi:hypothetical protein DFJ73DRAFT_630339 [Zopfochytrium polystomum]|nr:hypothetical protein DFJ73DRAFT_630339 [Zopfochytrium polystomum]
MSSSSSSSSRDNDFLEAAALGNRRAVALFLAADPPVNVNFQNAVNAWSALHWAAKRAHRDIVDLLLAHGADRSLRNSAGRTALDLAEHPDIRRALQLAPGGADADVDSDVAAIPDPASKTFTPSYLVNPDLSRLWAIPDSVGPATATAGDGVADAARDHAATPAPANLPASPAPHPLPAAYASAAAAASAATTPHVTDEDLDTPRHEVLVFLDTPPKTKLLGAVFVHPRATVADLEAQLRAEIDDAPRGAFALFRFNDGDETPVPINRGQARNRAMWHFRRSARLVIKPLE